MAAAGESIYRELLVDRRHRLDAAVSALGEDNDLSRLIREVDAALDRFDQGSYGLCGVCHESIESGRLLVNPLERFCLDHLTASEQRALEKDLDLAGRIQRGLLPEQALRIGGWNIAYYYKPEGQVSGDYCDAIASEDGNLCFIVGDVSGKGVAASMLMAHLHAMFRALIPAGLSLSELIERASRLFCGSTLPTHFATLVCAKAGPSGEVEICNAGHPSPLIVRRGEVLPIEATGLPIGLFCDQKFTTTSVSLAEGDAILIYTDGLSEIRNNLGAEYGSEKLMKLAGGLYGMASDQMVRACVEDSAAFRQGTPYADDVTVMAIKRAN